MHPNPSRSLRATTVALAATALATVGLPSRPPPRPRAAAPHQARYSAAQLAAVTSALNAHARIPGTAWATEPQRDQVVVSIDRRSPRRIRPGCSASSRSTAARCASSTSPARCTPTSAAATRSTAGSTAARSASTSAPAARTTSSPPGTAATSRPPGTRTAATPGCSARRPAAASRGNDYAIVQYTGGVAHAGTVDLYNGSTPGHHLVPRTPSWGIGQAQRQHDAACTAARSRRSTRPCNYAEGTVSGLIKTNVCAESGDSGGSLFAGTKALGLTSGGSGNCSSGGTTYFQPRDRGVVRVRGQRLLIARLDRRAAAQMSQRRRIARPVPLGELRRRPAHGVRRRRCRRT